MIGGSPVFFSPAPVTMLPPGYGPVPYAQPPAPRPVAPVRVAQDPAPRPATIRAQMPDDLALPARIAPVALPSPDQLGVTVRPADGACDWTAIHRRMQELGVVS